MPRARRPENKGFPTGWRWRGRSIYYMVPIAARHHFDGKREFKLGRTVAEAYRTWSERCTASESEAPQTMASLVDRYLTEHVPTLRPKTQESYMLAIRRIRAVFGQMTIGDITQQHVRQFYNRLARDNSKATARSTCGVLKHLMTMAAEWGSLSINPLLGMRFAGASPARRFLTSNELGSILSFQVTNRTERVGLIFVRLALSTGLRRGDLLALRVSDTTHPDGIRVRPRKTSDSSGIEAIFEWTDELRGDVEAALALSPRRIGDAPLIATRQGKSYIDQDGKANGFDSLSRRFIDATISRGVVAERWTMKDLRAAVGSHAETLDEASRQLMHSSKEVTDKHYRRAPLRLQPASLERFEAD